MCVCVCLYVCVYVYDVYLYKTRGDLLFRLVIIRNMNVGVKSADGIYIPLFVYHYTLNRSH